MADSKKEDIIRRCQCMRMTVDAGYNLKGMLLTGNQCKGMFNSLGQIILDAEEMQKTIENLEERIAIMSEGGDNKLNHHEVACIIANLFGDPCACNFNDIDEWLPQHCDFTNTCCPNPVGVACWEQYLKHLDKMPAKDGDPG